MMMASLRLTIEEIQCSWAHRGYCGGAKQPGRGVRGTCAGAANAPGQPGRKGQRADPLMLLLLLLWEETAPNA